MNPMSSVNNENPPEITTLRTNKGNAAHLATTAKTPLSEQGDVKEEGSVLWYATDD